MVNKKIIEWKAFNRSPKGFDTNIKAGIVFCSDKDYYSGYMNLPSSQVLSGTTYARYLFNE